MDESLRVTWWVDGPARRIKTAVELHETFLKHKILHLVHFFDSPW